MAPLRNHRGEATSCWYIEGYQLAWMDGSSTVVGNRATHSKIQFCIGKKADDDWEKLEASQADGGHTIMHTRTLKPILRPGSLLPGCVVTPVLQHQGSCGNPALKAGGFTLIQRHLFAPGKPMKAAAPPDASNFPDSPPRGCQLLVGA